MCGGAYLKYNSGEPEMEGSENQVHPQQHKELEASLQHMRSNLKKGKERRGKLQASQRLMLGSHRHRSVRARVTLSPWERGYLSFQLIAESTSSGIMGSHGG